MEYIVSLVTQLFSLATIIIMCNYVVLIGRPYCVCCPMTSFGTRSQRTESKYLMIFNYVLQYILF